MGGQAMDGTLCTPCARLLSLDTVYLSALTFVLNAALGAVSVPPSLSLCLSVSHFIFFLVPVSFSSVLIFIMLCDSLPSLPSLLCHQLLSLNKVIKLSTLFSLVCILTWQVYFLSVALKENMGLLKKKSVQGGVRANLWEKAIRETRNPY